MLGISIAVSIIFLGVVLAPFFLTKRTKLQAAALTDSVPRLVAEKKALLARYVEDEDAFKRRVINKLMWEQRRQYLINRYIDVARRLDYLNHVQGGQS